MTGLALREPTEADAAAISALCNAVTRSLYGEADADEREVRTWFALPGLAMFLVERGAEACGYADVRREGSGTRFPIDLRVAPVRARQHVAQALLAAIETWARERMQPGSIGRAFVAERDVEIARTLGSRGYRLIRHFYTMEIRLTDRLEQPEWPDGLSVRTFDPERDEEAVYECVQESFADHWDYHRITFEEFRSLMIRDGFDPGCGGWSRTAASSRESALTGGTSRATEPSAGSGPSASGGRGDGVGSRSRSSAIPLQTSAAAAPHESASASTRRTRRARCDSTSAPGCALCGETTPGRRRCESARSRGPRRLFSTPG